MERHTVAQLEGVNQSIVRNFPTFGQTGHNRPVTHETGEPFEDIRIKHAVNGAGGGACWVKMRWFKLKANCDVGLLRLCRAKAGSQRKRGSPGKAAGH